MKPMRNLSLEKFVLALLFLSTGLSRSYAAAAVYSETAGRVVVEAEHFAARLAEPIDPFHDWKIVPTEDPGDGTMLNPRGEYIQNVPNSGANHNTLDTTLVEPSVDYYIEINTPGTYQFYARWAATSGNNSFYVEILELKDGVGGTIADWYRLGMADASAGEDDFNRTWDGAGGFESNTGDAGGVPIIWNFQYPGVYTVRLHMREDAAAVDTILLQTSSQAAPAIPGPAESVSSTSYVRIT